VLTFRLTAVWLVACLFAFRSAAQQPSQSPLPTAFVQIRVNTAYDDSDESLALLRTIARYAPLRRVPLSADDHTLDAIFIREYGFGKSELPKSYAILLSIILERNHVSRAQELRVGALLMPAIPKRAFMLWNRNNLRNYVANMYLFSADLAVPASSAANRSPKSSPGGLMESPASELAYTRVTSVDEPRPTAPFALLSMELGLKQAVDLVESNFLPPGTLTVSKYPMPVKLAEDSKCDTEPSTLDHPTLTPDQAAQIIGLLKRGSQRAPVVFILDTGWPSLTAYQESVIVLNGILDDVWRREFGRPFSASPPQNKLLPANNGHCRCIERALKELRALDQGLARDRRVRVVYVPLTREQGAESALTDLLQTRILLDRQSAEKVVIDDKIVNGSRKEAGAWVKKAFPEKWTGSEVVTEKSILDAVLMIGQAFAKISGTVFFANESWTVRHPDYGGQYYVEYQTPEYGMVTAATGNDGSTNLLDFAQRSPSAKDTMAVLNISRAGVDRTSTRMEQENIDASMAAGFDGYVTNDVFGTSFSAPRIAWFLAAGEAVRAKPVNLGQWAIGLQEILKKLRDPVATDYQKLLFNPVAYIERQAGTTITSTR
jgi:hypothetical protein